MKFKVLISPVYILWSLKILGYELRVAGYEIQTCQNFTSQRATRNP